MDNNNANIDVTVAVLKKEVENVRDTQGAQALGLNNIDGRVLRMEEWRIHVESVQTQFQASVERRFTDMIASHEKRFNDVLATIEKHRSDDKADREKEKKEEKDRLDADKAEQRERNLHTRWFIGLSIPAFAFLMHFIDWLIKHFQK